MSNGATKRRDIAYESFQTSDSVKRMLLTELVNWLRTAEVAEDSVLALLNHPMDEELKQAYDAATQEVVMYPTEWIAHHCGEKAPNANIPDQLRDIRKLLQRVDFLLMKDPTVPDDQVESGVRARVRGQAVKIDEALNHLAESIQGIMTG